MATSISSSVLTFTDGTAQPTAANMVVGPSVRTTGNGTYILSGIPTTAKRITFVMQAYYLVSGNTSLTAQSSSGSVYSYSGVARDGNTSTTTFQLIGITNYQANIQPRNVNFTFTYLENSVNASANYGYLVNGCYGGSGQTYENISGLLSSASGQGRITQFSLTGIFNNNVGEGVTAQVFWEN